MQGSGLATTPSKPRMRKCPQRVGRLASATLITDAKGIDLIIRFEARGAAVSMDWMFRVGVGCRRGMRGAAAEVE